MPLMSAFGALSGHVEALAVAWRSIPEFVGQMIDCAECGAKPCLATQCADVVLHRLLKRLLHRGRIEIAGRRIRGDQCNRRLCVVGVIWRPMHSADIVGGAAAGTAAKRERLGNRVAGQPVGAVGAADRFSGGKKTGQISLHPCVGHDATHVVVRDRCHLDRHLGEIDAIGGETVDHWPEGFAQCAFRAVLKAEIDSAMRRTPAGFDLLENRVTADVPRDDVFSVLGHAVALREFLHGSTEPLGEPMTFATRS